MKDNKQTAVEWLYNELLHSEPYILEWMKLLKQAKEMEKQQIIDAYDKGEFNLGCNGDAEQYYQQTYGGNK
jgi:hypothetical protein